MGTAIKHSVPDRVKRGTLALSPKRQSARMSEITNDGLTRSGTVAVPVCQQWTSKDQRPTEDIFVVKVQAHLAY